MRRLFAALLALATAAGGARAYPLDGSEYTGITRLRAYDLAREALLARGTLVPGSLAPMEAVQLHLLDRAGLELPEADPGLTARLRGLLGEHPDRYAVSLLDLTDPERPRYAEHNGETIQNPGSVGKILVALAWFQALADLHPDGIEARADLLREARVAADGIIRIDSHEVPFWQPGDERVRKRPLQVGDEGSLWTYLDWMLSSSSNAAASVLQAQLLLLRHFGPEYPVSAERAGAFFRETRAGQLGALLQEALLPPLVRAGLDPDRLRQGSFFTAEGKRRVPGGTSVATTRELIRYLLRLEQGRLVDPWSSLEIKRLLYLTDRRIRYASHPALAGSAVYFKSGSLYSCKPEPEFICAKYHGNMRNYMNSVAIVETPREGRPLHYLVAVLSNVLRENSAVAHQTLALRVHRLVESLHPVPPRPAPGPVGPEAPEEAPSPPPPPEAPSPPPEPGAGSGTAHPSPG